MNSPEELMDVSKVDRAASPTLSEMSKWSREIGTGFKRTGSPDHQSKVDRAASPTLSEMSKWSKEVGNEFKRTGAPQHQSKVDRAASPTLSDVSKWSREIGTGFKRTGAPDHQSLTGRSVGDSGVASETTSTTSDQAQPPPPNINHEVHIENLRYAKAGDVVCGLCEGRKFRACKSCLTCLASFCERHIRDHYTVEPLRRHLLVEVTKNLNILQENAHLKRTIKELQGEKTVMKKEIAALKQTICELRLPDYTCKGKIPAAADLTLDPGSAYCFLVLSEDGKRVRLGERKPSDCGARIFDKREFVLATDGFTSGRHYWEVEVNREFTIGVTRASAERRGKFNLTPPGGYWCLYHYIQSFTALEEPSKRLPIGVVPRVLGVCVDVEERWVTFYNAETKAPIYTFTQMDFTDGERIYPVFSTLEKSADLKIRPVRFNDI